MRKTFRYIKRYLVVTITILSVLVYQTAPLAFAEDSLTPPPAPTAAPAPENPVVAPTAPPAPSQNSISPTPTPTVSPTPPLTETQQSTVNNANTQSIPPHITGDGLTPQQATLVDTVNNTSTEMNGKTTVNTSNATNEGTVTNTGNNNLATQGVAVLGGGGGATVANTGNGVSSTNTGSATIANSDSTQQTNSGAVTNGMQLATVTGQNNASMNVGDSSVTTGNANTTGTAITAVNTNVQGVLVSEFNITDNHTGDIILLPSNGTCVSGCGGSPARVTNTDNGANSTNNANIASGVSDTTFQRNDGSVGNDMKLAASSGDNKASYTTNGGASITTGDANVAANALTFVNNNISGNVLYNVVNIFGELVGDIILPDSILSEVTGLSANNSGNGANSTNNATIANKSSDTTNQFNVSDIDNNVITDAQTGNNQSAFNTDGDSSITTGAANVTTKTLNITNSNVKDGKTWWLVIINRAGQWFGKILGFEDGALLAGSEGTEFSLGSDGDIMASNGDNGAGSINNATVSENNTSSTTQQNTGRVINNLDLRANTGGNQTTYNTGGNSSIKTGNANILANLVNFVNNNIAGKGKLVVTVVNVFGKWIGDLVTPGQQQRRTTQQVSTTTSHENTNNTNSATNIVTNTNSNNTANSPVVSSSLATAVTNIQRVVAYFSGGQQTNNNVEVTTGVSQGTMSIMGTHTLGDKIVNKNTGKMFTINLAWIILLSPLLLAVVWMRKLLFRRKI